LRAKVSIPSFRFVVMKQINPKHCTSLPKIRALTSINNFYYSYLFGFFGKHVVSYLSLYALKGKLRLIPGFKERKNSSLYGSVAKLDFMLLYIKENPTQSYHGCLFELSQSKVSEWFSLLLPLLAATLKELKLMAGGGDTFRFKASEGADYLAGDVVERLIPRLTCRKAQKAEYSGKKKLHTNKNFAITRPEGRVVFLSEIYEGSVHEKTIWNELEINIEEHSILLDSGFDGAEKQCPTAITPSKKPKEKELSESKKAVNTGISKKRAIIENVFEMIKRLRIIREKIRIKGFDRRNLVMKVATAIHNLRIKGKKTN
jgi:hypothetical protein